MPNSPRLHSPAVGLATIAVHLPPGTDPCAFFPPGANGFAMKYADLVAVYDRLEATEANLELTAIVAETLAEADEEHLPLLVKLLRGDPFAAWKPDELGLSSSLTTEAIAKATGVDEDAIEDAWRETGDLGSAAKWAVEHERQQTLFSDDLTVRKVHDTLQAVAAYEGTGSQGKRIDAVAGLIADADPDEAKYVVRTVLGHLRLGIGEGTIRDAIAEAFLADRDEDEAFEEAVAAVEFGFQVTNDYREVAETARDEGVAGLHALEVELCRPLRVMLAKKADGLADAFETVAGEGVRDGAGTTATDEEQLTRTSAAGDEEECRDDGGTAVAAQVSESESQSVEDATEAAVGDGAVTDREVTEGAREPALLEYKLDGFRVQIHKDGDEVTVFTRRLEDVTHQFPEIAERVRECFDADTCIIEGEVLAYDAETDEPLPFQELSRRIKRKYDVAEMREEIPVGVHLFDCLYLDGETYLEAPLRERVAALEDRLDGREREFQRMAHVVTADLEVAGEFYEDALAAGQEGLMVKNRDASYQPGSRVGYMVKVKPTMEPLDLTVVRAKWSEGRRRNRLGRLYLACRDPETDEFLEVGRLSTGFTDEELLEMTERLEETIVEQDGREVVFEPSQVIEVVYEEIQESPEYESGFALRFPRFEGFRDDLSLADVDSLERVEALYEEQ
jgi:DNA ligase-1